MHQEIEAAAKLLVSFLKNQKKITTDQLEKIEEYITNSLQNRYNNHWFPDKPNKGSAYRCIRINGTADPIIKEVALKVGMSPQMLHKMFPAELTIWVDPCDVSYRIGEIGSICPLLKTTQPVKPKPVKPAPVPSQSPAPTPPSKFVPNPHQFKDFSPIPTPVLLRAHTPTEFPELAQPFKFQRFVPSPSPAYPSPPQSPMVWTSYPSYPPPMYGPYSSAGMSGMFYPPPIPPSPELYLDPSQQEQINPMADFIFDM